ncbi:MAG: quinone-dependent dihydroorotate dehydrogenase, partial [Alphaproteobacteria bacterium]
MANPYKILRPALFALPAERAHGLTIAALKTGLAPGRTAAANPALVQRLAGLDFPNPVGLAAGFDKNAEVPDAMLAQGFGFVEVGTLTPRPQPGNPRPRLFRLIEDEAVINRLGFNNQGHEAAARRLAARKGRPGLVGINLGANKDSDDRVADYAAGIRRFAGLAGYFTINISSPNTPGLRDLQGKAALQRLLDAVLAAGPDAPVFLKVAPDLEASDIDDIVEVVTARRIAGLIVANTTLARPASLKSRHARQAGGLSGRPLMAPSTAVLAAFYRRVGKDLPLVGVGGISGPEDAYAKIRAGASLVQLYTALVYRGPGLAARIQDGLARLLAADGHAHVSDAVGTAQ